MQHRQKYFWKIFSSLPKNYNATVTSNVFVVSHSIDIIARFVSLSSVIVDLRYVLRNFNFLNLRSTVLRTAVIGKLSL